MTRVQRSQLNPPVAPTIRKKKHMSKNRTRAPKEPNSAPATQVSVKRTGRNNWHEITFIAQRELDHRVSLKTAYAGYGYNTKCKITPEKRKKTIQFITDVALEIETIMHMSIPDDGLMLAYGYLDSFLTKEPYTKLNDMDGIARACLWIACKVSTVSWIPRAGHLDLSGKDATRYEARILGALRYRVHLVTVNDYVVLMTEQLKRSAAERATFCWNEDFDFWGNVSDLALATALPYELTQWNCLTVAIGVVWIVCEHATSPATAREHGLPEKLTDPEWYGPVDGTPEIAMPNPGLRSFTDLQAVERCATAIRTLIDCKKLCGLSCVA